MNQESQTLGVELSTFEEICNELYSTKGVGLFDDSKVLQILKGPNTVSLFIYALEYCSNPYALFLLATYMRNKSNEKNSIERNALREIHRATVSYLLHNSNTHTNVRNALTSLVGQLAKQCWLSDVEFRHELVYSSILSTEDIFIRKVGLEVLFEIVNQINTYSPDVESKESFRTTSILFRDSELTRIVKIAISEIKKEMVCYNTNKDYYYLSAMRLFVACMSYDFQGLYDDEDKEEMDTIYMPAEWSPYVCEMGLSDCFFTLYYGMNIEVSSLALQCLLCVVSIRRSAYASQENALTYYEYVMDHIIAILQSKTHLTEPSCHSFVSQYISKLKVVIQIRELIEFKQFPIFFSLVAEYGRASLQSSGYFNDTPFILIFWGRIIEALFFTSAPLHTVVSEDIVHREISSIVSSFVHLFVDYYDLFSSGAMESPLENKMQFQKYTVVIGTLLRYDYSTFLQDVSALVDQYSTMLQELYDNRIDGNDENDNLVVCDNVLGWCLLLFSMTLQRETFSDRQKNQYSIDTRIGRIGLLLIRRVLKYDIQYLQHLHHIIDSLLEFAQALLFIMSDYKLTCYLHPQPITSNRMQAYTDYMDGLTDKDVCNTFNTIVFYLLTVLNIPSVSQELIQFAVIILSSLSSNQHTQPVLLQLPALIQLIQNHYYESFAALQQPENLRFRSTFYKCLTSLVLIDTSPGVLELFCRGYRDEANSLSTMSVNPRNAMIISQHCRDLVGIAQMIVKGAQYRAFYEDLLQRYLPVLNNYMQSFPENQLLVVSILRFCEELCNNRKDRIDFTDYSPDSILMFRSIASIINHCLTGVLAYMREHDHNPSIPIRKQLTLVYGIMVRILQSDYVPFAGMLLYKESTIIDLVYNILCIQHLFPSLGNDVYTKQTVMAIRMLKALFTNNLYVVSCFSPSLFQMCSDLLYQAVSECSEEVSKDACEAIDSLATFLYIHSKSNYSVSNRIIQLIDHPPSYWEQLFSCLFSALLFSLPTQTWSLSRPLFSIYLLQPSCLNAYYHYLCSIGNSSEVSEKVYNIFKDLNISGDYTLDSLARDAFSHSINKWRKEIVHCLTQI